MDQRRAQSRRERGIPVFKRDIKFEKQYISLQKEMVTVFVSHIASAASLRRDHKSGFPSSIGTQNLFFDFQVCETT